MHILILLAGLILMFAGPWFTGQETVALILVIAGVVLIVVPMLFMGGLFGAATRGTRRWR